MKSQYVDVDEHGAITAVYCKRCGATLQGLLPDARLPIQHRKIPGANTVIQEIRVRLQPTAAYAEVVLELKAPDGRLIKHVTPLCKACKQALTKKEAKDLYQYDVDEWVRGAQTPADKTRLAALGNRVVQRILSEEDA